MSYKKGFSIPLLGTVIIIIAIIFFATLTSPAPFQMGNLQRGGVVMSLSNYAEFWKKALDESLQIVAQRSAYEIGKVGGIGGTEIAEWTTTYPSMDVLKQDLENKIKQDFPKGVIGDEETVNWWDDTVNVSEYDNTCGPIENSKCFFINVTKNFSVYYKSIDTKISFNPYEFYKNISSNYFKLLNAGRSIMEDTNFNTKLNNSVALLTALNAAKLTDPRFKNLDFGITAISTNMIEISIVEKCYPNVYCLTPLKPGEIAEEDWLSSIGKSIPYDYLKLKFRAQTN